MKKDIYKDVTDSVVKQIEGGVLPWTQPWSSKGLTAGLPINALSENPYSGINVLILWATMIENDYQSGKFLTYKQAKTLGGGVKKGEHGTTCTKYGLNISKAERRLASQENREPQARRYMTAFALFNIEQCENLPDSLYDNPVEMPEREKIDRAEKIMLDSGARIKIGGAKAFYSIDKDLVQLPPQPAFDEHIDYYRTAFHELGHWTGHKSRLNRVYGKRFGDSCYAFEELVAEMTSAFVCASLNIQPTVRHADYVGSWLIVLKRDKTAIFKAASLASKAANLLLKKGIFNAAKKAA